MSRTITPREASLLEQFGFYWAKGRNIDKVEHDLIQKIEPTENGMEVIYTKSSKLAKSVAVIDHIEIPSGEFSSGGTKDLSNAWIFAYFDHIEDVDREGRSSVRQLTPV